MSQSEEIPFTAKGKCGPVTVTVYPTGHVHIEITPDPDERVKENINKKLQSYKGKIISSKEATEIAELINSLL
jgi:hypothetical protein